MISANSYMFRHQSAILKETGACHALYTVICVLLCFT